MVLLDRSVAPAISDFEDYRLAAPESFVSTNGIASHFFRNSSLDLLHFTLLIKAGKNYEKAKCVADACFNVLKEHRADETSADFSALIDGFGASLRVNVYMESVYINIIVPKRNAEKCLDLIFELLLNPSFEEQDIDIYKKRKIKDLQYQALRVDIRALQLLFSNFFKRGTPTQTVISEELVNKVTVNQIVEYYKESVCAENMTFFAAGNIDDDLKEKIDKLLLKVPNNKRLALVSEITHDDYGKKIEEEHEDAMQTAVLLCRRILEVSDDTERELDVLTTLYGNYFGSRLMQNLRERHGYTYNVSCISSRFGEKDMLFYVSAEVNKNNRYDVVEECFNEMRRLKTEPVGADELQIVKNYLQGSLLRNIDGVTSIMKYFSSLCVHHACDVNEFYLQRDAIKNISSERIMALSNLIFDETLFASILVG